MRSRYGFGLTVLIVAALSCVALAIEGGRRLKDAATEAWLDRAEEDANRISGVAYSNVTQALTTLRAYSVLFHGTTSIDDSVFSIAVENAYDWDADVQFDAVAYARRVPRAERSEFERAFGRPVTIVGTAGEAAPVIYESFVVTHATADSLLLRRGDDLASMKELSDVVATAFRTPDRVVMGPAIELAGNLYALIGFAAPNDGGEGVLVAIINLGDFFQLLLSTQKPKGLEFRLSERDNEARAVSRLEPLIGPPEAPDDAAKTFTVRTTHGQARWELYWDVLPDYLGGPNHAPGQLVQAGGSAFILLVCTGIGLLLRQNRRIQGRVEDRTAELTRAHEQLEIRVVERTSELQRANEAIGRENKERKRAETALRESRDQLRLVTDNLPVLIVYLDAEQRYRFVNQTCAEWYARPAEDILGKNIAEIYGKEYEKFRPRIERVLNGETLLFEDNITCPDGVSRVIRGTFIPHKGMAEKVEGFFALGEDITDLKGAEEKLRQAHKMEALGQLTGGVAHDFNNLLAVIQGNAELVADHDGVDSLLTQAILRASARGAELTQRLLAFSRQQPLQPKEIDLADLMAGMSDMLTRTLGETIEIETGADVNLWTASADPGQVENALLNLALNARDAMPGGGKLTIECMNVSLDGTYVAENPGTFEGDYVVLAVTDGGFGMSTTVREHAFEPFFTTKEVGQGSGLGLSMVYGFAKQSGGHVSIYSEEQRGTTVKIYLPRGERTSEAAPAETAGEAPRGRGEVVLVLEDDADVRALAVRMLERLGYRVIEVAAAAAAREVLAGGERVDLVLSDVVLPGGMSGPDFADEAGALAPGLEFVFMSGYPATAAKRNGFLGAERVLLTKPFQRAQLAKAMRDALD